MTSLLEHLLQNSTLIRAHMDHQCEVMTNLLEYLLAKPTVIRMHIVMSNAKERVEGQEVLLLL